MNNDAINTAFNELIFKKAVHKSIGISASYLTSLRYKLSNDITISTDLKLKLLQKSGWRQDDICYTQTDMVKLVKFALRQGAAGKEQGAEYLTEKFLKSRQAK